MNTIFAWIIALPNINADSAYRFYKDYKERYNDNIPELSKNEFIVLLKSKEDDEDYKRMKKFYKEYLK